MFQSQTALVTGAAQGIGAAVAHALAQAGAKLALLDIQEQPLTNIAEQLRVQGATVCTYPVNIAERQQVADCIEDILNHLGPIHILVNVAAVLRTSPILHLNPQDWQHTLNVNLNGVFNLSQIVAQHMVQHRIQGRIVSVSSNAASTPRIGMAAYAASKAAVTQFTKCLGLELAPHGIRCNIVSPGSTDTPMQQQFTPTPESQQQVLHGNLEQHRLGIPLQRIASPQDIANSVMFLLSEQARHITMHDLRVDGGATLGG